MNKFSWGMLSILTIMFTLLPWLLMIVDAFQGLGNWKLVPLIIFGSIDIILIAIFVTNAIYNAKDNRS